jgi:hypothetical protein
MDKQTISEVMRAMGSKGGKIGGKRRMEMLSDAERKELAMKGVAARSAKRVGVGKKGTARKRVKVGT